MIFHVRHVDETDSTNRYLRSTHPSPLTNHQSQVVVADYQTAGCGQGTNSWESERGKNLTFSIRVEDMGIKANRQFLLSMMVSVALTKTLSRYLPVPAAIKWPNDIYVGDRKICGILIEHTLQGDRIKSSIIGIGLNVNQMLFVSDAPNPVSMAMVCGRQFDREQVLQDLLADIGQMLEERDESQIRTAYLQQLYRCEGIFPYADAQGSFQARLMTVEDDGRLVLQDTAGLVRRYAFKEVSFAP